MKKTKRFNWPTEVQKDESDGAETEFYSGAFITMLLNKVFLKSMTNFRLKFFS